MMSPVKEKIEKIDIRPQPDDEPVLEK